MAGNIIGQLVAKLLLDAGQFHSGLQGASKELSGFGAGLRKFSSDATDIGSKLSLGVTVPLAGLAVAAGKVAVDYQSSMNMFQAVTSATADQMAAAGAKAKELGADMTLPATSAGDAATAMTELAKAGLSVEDTLAASKGVLQLSAAGHLSNAQAAEIAANALNSFGLSGEKASQVADLLAATANASSVEVKDMGDSFKMGAAVFSAFQGPAVGAQQSMIDMSTAIGLLGNAGIKGSDAGTSLKQMLLQLTGPSSKAKGLMRELASSIGETGDIAFRANGQMRSVPEIMELVSRATKNMTDEQRDYAITQIFGADASRAAIALMRAGSDGWNDMAEKVTKGGAAADLAGARMKGLGGALEGLKSQAETTLLALAEPFLGFLEGLVRGIADLVGAIPAIPTNLLLAAAAFAAVLAVAGPVLLLLGSIAGTVAGAVAAFTAASATGGVLVGVIAALGGPITLIIAGIALLAAAFAGDFMGIRTAATPVIESLVQGFSILKDTIGGLMENDGLSLLDASLQAISMRIQDVFGDEASAQFDAFTQAVGDAFDTLGSTLQTLPDTISGIIDTLQPQIAGVTDFLLTQFGNITSFVDENFPLMQATAIRVGEGVSAALELIGNIIQTMLPTIQAIWTATWQTVGAVIPLVFDMIATVISAALEIEMGLIKAAMQVITGDWTGAWATVENTLSFVWGSIGNIVSDGVQLVIALLKGMADSFGAVVAFISPEAAAIGAAIVSGILSGLGGLKDAVGQKLADGLTAALAFARGPAGIDAHSPSRQTKEKLGKPMAQGIIDGFMQELTANRANFAASMNKLTAELASDLVLGIQQNTPAAGKKIAIQLDKVVNELRKDGVENWRELGDDLAGAIHDALIAKTPELRDAALDQIDEISDIIDAAIAAKHTALAGYQRAVSDAMGKAQAQQTFGGGADVSMSFIQAMTSNLDKDATKFHTAMSKFVADLQKHAVPEWEELGSALEEAALAALTSGSEEDIANFNSLLAQAGGQLATTIDNAKPKVKTAVDHFLGAITEVARSGDMIHQFGEIGAEVVSNLTSEIENASANTEAKLGNSIQKMIAKAKKIGVDGAQDTGNAIIQSLADAINTKDPVLIAAAIARIEAFNAQMEETAKAKSTLSATSFATSWSNALQAQGNLNRFGTAGVALMDAAMEASTKGGAKAIDRFAETAAHMAGVWREKLTPDIAETAVSELFAAVEAVTNGGGAEALAALDAVIAKYQKTVEGFNPAKALDEFGVKLRAGGLSPLAQFQDVLTQFIAAPDKEKGQFLSNAQALMEKFVAGVRAKLPPAKANALIAEVMDAFSKAIKDGTPEAIAEMVALMTGINKQFSLGLDKLDGQINKLGGRFKNLDLWGGAYNGGAPPPGYTAGGGSTTGGTGSSGSPTGGGGTSGAANGKTSPTTVTAVTPSTDPTVKLLGLLTNTSAVIAKALTDVIELLIIGDVLLGKIVGIGPLDYEATIQKRLMGVLNWDKLAQDRFLGVGPITAPGTAGGGSAAATNTAMATASATEKAAGMNGGPVSNYYIDTVYGYDEFRAKVAQANTTNRRLGVAG